MAERRSRIDELSDEYIRRYVELSPTAGVSLGVAEPPEGLTRYGPESQEQRAQLSRDFIAAVGKETVSNDRDRIAAESIRERLTAELDQHDAGEWMRELRVFGSPFHAAQSVFELLPQATPDDWEGIARRMSELPATLDSFRESLELGVSRGVVAAKRQARACSKQTAGIGSGYFTNFVGSASDGQPGQPGRPGAPGQSVARTESLPVALVERLSELAAAADAAYVQLSEYLGVQYMRAASDHDPVGRERYTMGSRRWTGLDLDLEETYAWGWEDLREIQSQMREVSEQIKPGGGVDGAIELLETDRDRSILGVENLIGWLQELMDTAISELTDSHFEIPEPVRKVEARVAPPGSAAAMYYTRPSADFSRPGRTWYPVLDRERFPRWVEVSTCYHEGVPGHHLQFGYTCWLGDRLNSFQRYRAMVSGHSEGWALYAERLMGELGYLENPDYRLGMLAAQAHRAARVIVDIGMHLQLKIPSGESYHPGETWTPDLALPFMVDAGRRTEAFMASEIDRYLGWPGQAISYKVGERVWLETRDIVRAKEGASFDLKRFHTRAFDLGLVGLGQLRRELGGT
jgi:uncharacterized protein (DUF885 family)